jgi:hypothetical protein
MLWTPKTELARSCRTATGSGGLECGCGGLRFARIAKSVAPGDARTSGGRQRALIGVPPPS